MVGESREILLLDDVVVARRRRVETVEDDSNEQVHEYVRDGQRETFKRSAARWGLAVRGTDGVQRTELVFGVQLPIRERQLFPR